MEKFKIDIFYNKYKKRKFPFFRKLSKNESGEILKKISVISGYDTNITPLEIVKNISEKSISLPLFNAENENFSLFSVFDFLNIKPKNEVFINWFRFDDIDKISFEDLNNYFGDIWYPGPDDIDIFDESFLWILSISHYGAVFIVDIREVNRKE